MQIIRKFVYWEGGEKKSFRKRGRKTLPHFCATLLTDPWAPMAVSEQVLGAGHCSSPRVSSQFAFYIEEPERLACSHLHLEKLPLKWFPKSSAGNYPSSCWYKAEWAVTAATKAAHAERPASLFES